MESTDPVIFKLENWKGKDGTLYTRLQLGNQSVDWKHPLEYKHLAVGLEVLANHYTKTQDRHHDILIRMGEYLLKEKVDALKS